MRKVKATRILATLICAAAAACVTADPGAGPPQRPRITDSRQQPDGVLLLGTAGGPLARAERAGIATLLTIGGRNYLVDAGEGVVHQMGKAGMQAPGAPLVFLTHLHDDHYAGLPALASFSYTLRSPRLDVYGPVGTTDLVGGLVQVMGPSARIRAAEQGFRRTPAEFAFAHEIAEGKIYEDENVIVTALANTHYRVPADNPVAVSQSFSLRFAAKGRVIVFTGDTGPTAALADFAKGADILVAEMASHADRESVPPYVREHMDKEHLSPLEVGKLAAAAGVKTVVLSHVGETGQSDVDEIRSVFSGEIILGTDMLRLAF
jgi:ribonuclease BN (tRNA processing enzyme)